jgi:nucleoside-diphosphate-sugar epimerase
VRLAIAGNRTELGAVFRREATAAGHESVDTGPVDAYIDLRHQAANTLLSDGNAWQGFAESAVGRTQRRLTEARRRDAGVFIYTSFAFLRGADQPERLKEPLRSIVHAALACEEMVLAAPLPARVIRLGYLYGPWMKDLRGYRTAFRLGRPYWAGPRRAAQDHLHQLDACAAVLTAATSRGRARLQYATDGHPVPFAELMDHFARMAGNPLPLHIAGVFKLTAQLIIREEHMALVKLPMPTTPPAPMPAAWKPHYADYRDGVAQVFSEWKRR